MRGRKSPVLCCSPLLPPSPQELARAASGPRLAPERSYLTMFTISSSRYFTVKADTNEYQLESWKVLSCKSSAAFFGSVLLHHEPRPKPLPLSLARRRGALVRAWRIDRRPSIGREPSAVLVKISSPIKSAWARLATQGVSCGHIEPVFC